MARNINGGTDHIYYTVPETEPDQCCFAAWIRTTQATVNAIIASDWTSASRNGWGLIINNTANKITAQGYSVTTLRLNIASSTTINDGNPHHIAFNLNRSSGGANTLYVDGASAATGNSSGSWSRGSGNFFIELGDNLDAFWPPYVGDIWEAAYWSSHLSADNIAALAEGFAPPRVRIRDMIFYAPLVRDTRCLTSRAVQNDLTGTSVITHPNRIIGGLA